MWRIFSSLVLPLMLLAVQVPPAHAQAGGNRWPQRFGGVDEAASLSNRERAAFTALREAMSGAGATPCRASARLTSAARAHARQLLTAQTTAGRVDMGHVRQEVLRAGGFDPVVIPWALAFTDAPELDSRRGRLAQRFGSRPPTHCGVGLAGSENRQILVVIGVRRHLALEPFPSRLATGDRIRLQGQLDLDYRAPSVHITTPLGTVLEQQTLRRSGRFGTWLDFTRPGRYTVEVMATGPQGPEVVALFPVHVDTEPRGETREPLIAPSRRDGVLSSPGSRLLALLNEERHAVGLAPLQPDPRLALLATRHSSDMLRRGYFGHISPSGRDLMARLRMSGVTASRAAENLVRGGSPTRAHAQLMGSPSHRANILDRDLTHVGIGVAERDGELLVTQIFAEW